MTLADDVLRGVLLFHDLGDVVERGEDAFEVRHLRPPRRVHGRVEIAPDEHLCPAEGDSHAAAHPVVDDGMHALGDVLETLLEAIAAGAGAPRGGIRRLAQSLELRFQRGHPSIRALELPQEPVHPPVDVVHGGGGGRDESVELPRGQGVQLVEPPILPRGGGRPTNDGPRRRDMGDSPASNKKAPMHQQEPEETLDKKKKNPRGRLAYPMACRRRQGSLSSDGPSIGLLPQSLGDAISGKRKRAVGERWRAKKSWYSSRRMANVASKPLSPRIYRPNRPGKRSAGPS